MILRGAPVGGASDGVDPGCDGGQEILEDVLAASVLIEVLRAAALSCALPLRAPSAEHSASLWEVQGVTAVASQVGYAFVAAVCTGIR